MHREMSMRAILAATLWIGAITTAPASVPISGTLTAEHACQAYVSKNDKTNPNFQLLRIGASYPVFEANTADDPQWYRVRIEGAAPAERWVHKFCGEIVIAGGEPDPGTQPIPTACPITNCTLPDTEESYLLALSWQPAFCETSAGRSKPECANDDPDSYQAKHFTLHGLWPNKLSRCGTNYGYCGAVCTRPGGSMCNYPAVELSDPVRADLAGVMPSVDAGSCLQRHEWWKHGVCSGMDTDDYFTIATTLTREFNDAGPAALMAAHIGGSVAVETFLQTVDEAFGARTRNLLELSCNNGNLAEVRISLPKDIDEGEHLTDLFARMTRDGSPSTSGCGNAFRVYLFHFPSIQISKSD